MWCFEPPIDLTYFCSRNLRPAGSKERKVPKSSSLSFYSWWLIYLSQIPMPDSNPLTGLFNLCSCPNYTYEIGAWISFTIMTQVKNLGIVAFFCNRYSIFMVCIQCLPAAFFTIAGAYQMTMWALGKHRYLLLAESVQNQILVK